MPRAQSTDYLHSMRFQVEVADGTSGFLGQPQAGFSAVTVPEMTIESVEYKEGQMIYTRKFPGNPSMAELTMSRGVTKTDTAFWSWIQTVAEGGNYRADLRIKHYHRESLPNAAFPPPATPNSTVIDQSAGARVYEVHEAFPMRHKVASDLDATASEVSIMELDVAYEHFNVLPMI
jgi:phage tail-like protein